MKLLNASKFALEHDAEPTRDRFVWPVDRGDAAQPRRARRRGDRGVRGLRLRARARSEPRRSSGASATTTSSSSRAAATASRDPRAAAIGQRRAVTRAVTCCSRLFAPFLPFVTEESGPGGRTALFTRRRGRRLGRDPVDRHHGDRARMSGRPPCSSRCDSNDPCSRQPLMLRLRR